MSREPVMDLDALFGPEAKCDTSIPVVVRRYFADPPVLRSDDPLQWWCNNESRFPHGAKLARTDLAVPANSIPSERVFSAAANIVTKRRAALSPESINALIFFFNKNWPLLFKLSSAVDKHVQVKIETQTDEDQEPAMPDLPGS